MRTSQVWLLKSHSPRDEHTGWWVLRPIVSRTLTFQRLRDNYPLHDIQCVILTDEILKGEETCGSSVSS
jgi:hypothetical protein